MATTSMQFGQSTINVVLNEGQLPAKLSTDASGNTVLVGVDGAGLLTIDSDGYLLANMIPRRNTLTELLTNTAGGVGEISEATDWDALVLHNGVVGGAKVLYCKPKVCRVSANATSLVDTTPTPLPFTAEVLDAHSMWAVGDPTKIFVPSGANRVRTKAIIGFQPNATGIRGVESRLEGAAASVPGSMSVQTPSATAVTFISVSSMNATIAAQTYLQLYYTQTSGAALSTDFASLIYFDAEFWVE